MSNTYRVGDEPALTHTLGCLSWDTNDATDCDCTDDVHLAQAPTMRRALQQAFGESA